MDECLDLENEKLVGQVNAPKDKRFRAHAFSMLVEASYDIDDGEVWIENRTAGAWLSADEARQFRDWLIANVKD